jgi:D-alanyl-D-alanine carboxypeptidase (penicillin-binding protein 5/6)
VLALVIACSAMLVLSHLGGIRAGVHKSMAVRGSMKAAMQVVPSAGTRSAPPFSSTWAQATGMPPLGLHAATAIVVDVDARAVLWDKESHAARHPASLAKVMTVMVALDLAPLDRQVTVPLEATQVEGDSTVMGLSAGEVVTLEDLMYGVFLRSGNDAAETLARTLTDRAHFIDLMNNKAAALGMADSHFTNPTGLDDPAMMTTAYDMAVAAAAIVVRYSQLLPLAQARQAVMPQAANHKAYDMHALNRLVGTYSGATGLKTGYTYDAGYCLVGSAQRGPRHLVAVVMGDDLSLTTDTIKLLDYGFSTHLT